MYVNELEYALLTFLEQQSGEITVGELATSLGKDQSQVSATCISRAEWVEVREEERLWLRLGKKAQPFVEGGFPERKIIEALEKLGGQGDLNAVAEKAGITAQDVGQSLRFLKSKGWAEQQAKTLILTEQGKQAIGSTGADERLLEALKSGEQESSALQDAVEGLKLLQGRTGVVEERPRTLRWVKLSEPGKAAVRQGLESRTQVNQLTQEMMISGEWRQVDFRPYDVSLASEAVYPGKEHPFVSIIQQTRKVFLELGFEETVSPYVESSFWDFDALFQPQDHPARDMQDTFYISKPEQCKLPRQEWVDEVGATHRDGGRTGSLGWRYDWNDKLIKQPVLRTHTTASSIRALAENPNPPRKVFCVGPVFRRETVDYKHLPVFHQVDGIIIDEKASFASLLGTLQAFYRKMGFQKFQFRPAFFPYTEPSVEIFVWSDRKEDWVEMGGAGVFRPEVTEPFGCKVPVLAWGLGLERLAMFRYELGSIGELYRARLNWLKETPLCR
ncbi:MAG: phenylalanine--tRNA ligase subunit alpha [Candidatus Eremiobacteraeota bacterium]|nr:phenylalanine--tRNA ligase subunit alpha [Candidatus Eremiobacteraeota bacterium]MCW5868079.1 phenylalanine--tRNA ligase subunit alpha [Candidatus Eremiobacteraeota bacterium]